jgi:general secretion pathway protein K
MTRRQRGFALLTVLWVITGVAALALAGGLVARDALAAARNRVGSIRAAWRAEDCAERARAAIDEVLATGLRGDAVAYVGWRRLDDVVARSPYLANVSWCTVQLRAAGTTLDLNAADSAQLRRLLVFVGAAPERADSLVDAILDWRDVDDVPRPLGAERAWYDALGRRSPRNGPLAHVAELRLIRGLDSLDRAMESALDSAVGVEPGRPTLLHAAPAALATLPGFSDEAIARVLEWRAAWRASGSLSSSSEAPELLLLTARLSRTARDSLVAHYDELVPLVAPDPEAWIVSARATSAEQGEPAITATLELRLARADARAAIVRRRTAP